MKKIKNYITLLLITGLVSFSSCKKFIDPEINKDPNNPEDVPLNVILPGIEANLAYTYGSDLTRFPSLWIQTMSGLANQHLVFDNYSLTETDVNNMWYFNLFGGSMSDISVLIKKSAETHSPYYGGIAKILMANALGTVSDLWGDIPYSQAFKGLDNLKPAFDTQESIYASIQSLLDQGISDLGSATSNFTPTTDDFIYYDSGLGMTDLSKWIKFAHSLKARYYLHLVKRVPGNYATALSEIALGFADNSDNAKLAFGAQVTESNPIYQFFSSDRIGDAGVGKNLVDLMNSMVDPRRAVYFTSDANCTPDTCYSGSPAGVGDLATSQPGSFYNTPTSPTLFMTYSELLFIQAECAFQTGDLAGAATAYNAAVSKSLELYGTPDAGYLAANASETNATITIEKIFTQKYIHMFGQGTEGFTDWRRSCDATHPTGIPALTASANNVTSGVIPRRLPYANSERLQNGANLNAAVARQGGASVTDRVWWDK